MTIPASKVKSICTRSEAALVRASRKGELEHLSPAELKNRTAQARKLADKWQGLVRSQSRTRSRQAGYGDTSANTALKAQIFREALASFQSRLAELDGTKGPAARPAKPKSKRERSATHRASRAAVRKGMTAVEDLLNTPDQRTARRAAEAAAKPKPAPATSSKAISTKKGAPKLRPPATSAAPNKGRKPAQGVHDIRQIKAAGAAKQSRIAKSGKTTRMLGHVSARGKRSQARRDAKH
ncbi:MAG TPA: hypothetical protein VFW87_22405 [Pirellulales bacterium]|nr:hypothetical protein [Pirellulales bacterium]